MENKTQGAAIKEGEMEEEKVREKKRGETLPNCDQAIFYTNSKQFRNHS